MHPLVRIAEIESGSVAEDLHLEIGTRIIRINGQRVRDGIDLTFLLADTKLELETVDAEGQPALYDIEREAGESIGIIPAPDTIRSAGTNASSVSSMATRRTSGRAFGCAMTTFVSPSRMEAT